MISKNKLIFLSMITLLVFAMITTSTALQSKTELKYFEDENSYNYEEFMKNETLYIETDMFYQEDYDKMINDNLEGYINYQLKLTNGKTIDQYFTIEKLDETPYDLVEEGWFEECVELKPIKVPEENIFTIDIDDLDDYKLIYLTKDEYKP